MMKKNYWNSLLFVSIILTSCTNLPIMRFSQTPNILTPTDSETPLPTKIFTPTKTPTNKPTLTKTPTPTNTLNPTATIVPYSKIFPLDWPVPPISEEKIKQVKRCDINYLALRINTVDPKTTCYWAVLAYTYVRHSEAGDEIPEIAKDAFGQAISDNIGFAFSDPIFYKFFGSIPIVKQPPILEQDITRIKIEYSWEGGAFTYPVKYKIDIRNANSNPVVIGTGYEPITVTQKIKTTIDKSFIQALGSSFTNLLPIKNQFSLVSCDDNFPDWIVTLTLKDGTLIEVKTNRSNLFNVGGPWQINIDGQDYLQFSLDFIEKLQAIIKELGLPYGQPSAMTCAPEKVMKKAYP